MKTVLAKTLLVCSTVACLFAAPVASAAVFNPFTVKPTGPVVNNPFVADKITGNYVEVVTFNPDSTFDVSLLWNAGQFATNGGNSGLGAAITGLGFDYNLYALYKAHGNVSTSGTTTTFSFVPGTGSLKLFLDTPRNNDMVNFTNPGTGTGDFTITGSGDDTLIATGDPLSGLGTLNPALSTCGGGGINCGSFGSTTSFALTSAGAAYFIAPLNFYDLSFQSGQLNNFQTSGTQTINGSLDVVFARVPEPASAALLGLGLLGLGLTRRRKQS